MLGSPSVAAGMVFAVLTGNLLCVNVTMATDVWNFTDPAAIEDIVSSRQFTIMVTFS